MMGEDSEVQLSSKEWSAIYRMAEQQSMLGVIYSAVKKKDLPMDLAMQWALKAEAIRGLNELLNREASRLTRLFAEQGRKTAILKGQANARLYPDPLSRQPGDIDIWVEGGRKSVISLLIDMGLLVGRKDTNSYHHMHLPPNEAGIEVEVHFRPSSGNYNPMTNRRLQNYLEREIKNTAEGDFNVPSMKFALIMQLSHIQRHFLSGGIGLRQVCDYYLLLRNATEQEREDTEGMIKRFGLRPIAGALMWVLSEMLHLEKNLMISEPDSRRGEWLLRDMMTNGNFGHYAKRLQTDSDLTFFVRKVKYQIQMVPFAPAEMVWLELDYIKKLFKRIPDRIRHGRLSLRDYPE